MLKLSLKSGDVIIKTFDKIAPEHVQRIKQLVSSGFYNGLSFHIVKEGFIAQTGCPNGDGTGRSGQSISAEFSDLDFKKGTLAMARGVDVNSADCQFFICLSDCPTLKNKYTIWGEVFSGMEFISALKKGEKISGRVKNPDKIVKMEIIKT